MELYLDTADVEAVIRLAAVLPLRGVTTNPSIVAKAGNDIWTLLPQLHAALDGKGRLFAQVLSPDTATMVAEAKKLAGCVPDLVVKVPVTAAGLAAIKQLKQQQIATLGTAVYGAGQGLLAALAGADYVAPYVNRLDAQGGNGVEMVSELQQLLNHHCPTTQILAASFRTPRQAIDCLLTGCSAITLPLDVAEAIIKTPAVEAAVGKFEQDWQNAFNRTAL